MLVAKNTWEEVGHKGPITFGEDIEPLSGTCQVLDHSPAPWAHAAPQALAPVLCRAPPHKHHRCYQHELFAGAIYTQDRRTHFGKCEVLTTHYLPFHDMIAATLLLMR